MIEIESDNESSPRSIEFSARVDLFNDTVSPINISITNASVLQCDHLNWINYEVLPMKLELINTGRTIILIGKWHAERPYIESGPLDGKYIFSQLHFHWTENVMCGSEHTIDGVQYPLEMHVVHFKKDYLFPSEARKFDDGIIIATYIIKLQKNINKSFEQIFSRLNEFTPGIKRIKIDPIALSDLFFIFPNDYFMYRGQIECENSSNDNMNTWLISRKPIVISENQAKILRLLKNESGNCIIKNSKHVNPSTNDTQLFFVNPSGYQHASLFMF